MASSSSWRPTAATRPPSRNTTRSARRMVDTRWATTTVVVSRARPRPERIWASTVASMALVASSSTSSRGRRTRARARARRWRWPPERVTPRSPSTVSMPSGRAATKPSARARASAWCISSIASGGASPSRSTRPASTLAVTVSAKRNVSWNTNPTVAGRVAGSRSATSTPPRRTVPPVGSSSPARQRHSDVLPPAVAPVRATTSPGAIARVTSSSTGAAGSWAKRRPSASTPRGPSGGRVRPWAGWCSSGSTARTPSRRSAATTDGGMLWRRYPITRIGVARMANRASTSTMPPSVIAPIERRQAPRPSTITEPRLGRAVRPGSNPARSSPTRTRSARRSSVARAKRSRSWSARPSSLTTRAPSKLSWATAAMSP